MLKSFEPILTYVVNIDDLESINSHEFDFERMSFRHFKNGEFQTARRLTRKDVETVIEQLAILLDNME